MNKKELFYKAVIWQIIGFLWISILSYIWFDSLMRSLTFSVVIVIVSIFCLYFCMKLAWK